MKKKIFLWITAFFCIAACAVLSLSVIILFLKGSASSGPVFTAEKLQKVFLRALPFMIGAAVMTVWGLFLNIKDENNVRIHPLQEKDRKEPFSKNGRVLWGIRIGLVCFAVLLIAAGFFNGRVMDVLQKAIRICAECIGLG